MPTTRRRALSWSSCERRLISAADTLPPSATWFCHSARRSGSAASLAMASSLMKAMAQDLLDAVYLGRDVPRRQACDVADGRRVHAFEVEQHHLPIERCERVDQGEDPLHRTP